MIRLLKFYSEGPTDRLRWVPVAEGPALEKAFEIIDREPVNPDVFVEALPCPVEDLRVTLLEKYEALLAWEPLIRDRSVTSYTVTLNEEGRGGTILTSSTEPIRLTDLTVDGSVTITICENNSDCSGSRPTVIVEPATRAEASRFALANYLAATVAIWKHHEKLPEGFPLSQPAVDPEDPLGRECML